MPVVLRNGFDTTYNILNQHIRTSIHIFNNKVCYYHHHQIYKERKRSEANQIVIPLKSFMSYSGRFKDERERTPRHVRGISSTDEVRIKCELIYSTFNTIEFTSLYIQTT